MDPNLEEIPEDVLQAMGVDDLILWKHQKLEESVEKWGRKQWEEHWLPLHNTNLFENSTEVEQNGDKEHTENPQALIDTDSLSHQSWEDIYTDLRQLRNLSGKDLSIRELNLLETGCFMLYKVEVPFFSALITAVMNVQCTLCFVKYANSISMHILLENENIEVEFGEKNWVCRNGKRVSFHLGEGLIISIAEFNTVEEAMEFEFYFMFITEFADESTVVRVRGESAIKQLIFKGFTGEANSISCEENAQHRFVEYLNDTLSTYGPFSTKLYKNSFNEPMEALRRHISKYMNNAFKLKVFLFKSCISFDVETISKPYKILTELLVDFLTLTRTLAFCVMPEKPSSEEDPPTLRSFAELEKDLFSIFDNVVCCLTFCRVLSTYFQYKQQFIHIVNTVCDNIFCPHQLQNEPNLEHSCCEPEKDENGNSGFNLVSNMHNYFNFCQDDPTFPEMFMNLDKVLRVGNSSILDVLDKKFKTEFFEALSFSKTFKCVNKDFFGDRHSKIDPNILFRHNTDNSVPLSDLHEHFENVAVDDTNPVSAGEDFVCQFVIQCVALLRKLSHTVEKHMLKFDMNEWLTLVEIWRAMDPEYNDLQDALADEFSQETNEEAYFPASSSNNGFSFPKDWKRYHNYEDSEFNALARLGNGAYGSAEILKHDNLRRVVLKKYNIETKDNDIKREIDMLISLQDNPHIVKLLGFYYFDKEDFGSIPMGILLEYIERNLDSFIHDRTANSFKYRYRYKTAIEQMRGMASAFAAMHRQRIMHRDIKPDNILLTYADKIQVCDLGMCGSIDKKEKTNKGVGTHRYNSPELLDESSNYNEKTDVFSLGITMWEQIHRKVPYWKMERNSEIADFVCDGNRMEICDECPPSLNEIIQRAWAHDPDDRPSMEELEKALGEILSNLPTEVLNEDVLGPFKKVVRQGSVYYIEKIEYKKDSGVKAGVYFPENVEDLETLVRDGNVCCIEISENEEE